MAKKRTTKTKGYIYVGNGAYIHGVPARDLTSDEVAKYSDLIDQQQQLSGLVLYEPVTDSTADEEEV